MRRLLLYFGMLIFVCSAEAANTETEAIAEYWRKSQILAQLQTELKELITIHRRVQSEVVEFDRELERRHADDKRDGGTLAVQPLVRTSNYGRLMALRELQENQIDRIVALVRFAQAKKSSRIAKDRRQAARVLKAFKKAIDDQPAGTEPAYELLIDHLPDGLRPRPSVTSEQEQKQSDVKLEPAIEDMIHAAGEDWALAQVDGQVANQKIYPSIGKPGNISGAEFAKGVWGLTYDDGPSRTHTSKILKDLARHGISATFFWLAKLGPAQADLIKEAGDQGHLLAVHSYSHLDLTKSDSDLDREIKRATKELGALYGKKPSYFRCPYGSCIFSSRARKKTVRQIIADQKMVHVLWNVDTLDWNDRNPTSIFKRASKQMDIEKGGIVLFHDIHPQSVVASELLIKDYILPKRKALVVATIEDMVSEINGGVGSWH